MKFIKLNKHILSGIVLSLGATVINVFIPLYLKVIIDKQSFHPAFITCIISDTSYSSWPILLPNIC